MIEPIHEEIEHLVEKDYQLENLINMDDLRKILEDLYKIAPFPVALLNIKGDVLLQSHWEPICTKFHRVNPETAALCAKSDTHFNAELTKGDKSHVLYRCGNGLYDAASPVKIDGQHLGNFFIGQFLLAPPDIEFFRKQAQQYAFEEDAYLEALSRVPIISEQELEIRLKYLCDFAEFLGNIGLKEFQRDRAVQALRARGEFLDRVIDQSPFAVWISDAKGTLKRANPALKKFLNLTDEQLVGKYNVLEDPLIEKQGFMPLIRSVYEEGKSINFTAYWNGEDIPTMDLKGSNSVSIEANMFPIHSPEGELTHVVLNWVDITDRIKAEHDLKIYREHLEELVEERTAALEGKNKELETFTYSVSHDLKAPLRGIDGYSSLLVEEYGDKLDKEGHQFLMNVRNSAKQMNQLIEDLLAYSRMERREIQSISIDLSAMIDALIRERARDLEERNIELKKNIPFENILCDRESLRQILGNLLDNAIKFTRHESAARIEIDGSDTPEHWTLRVKDNGLGFDPKYQERIFGIFQRLHLSEEYPGTGVGLAIARKAISRMGGRIWAEGELGKGAVFCVRVPKLKNSFPAKG